MLRTLLLLGVGFVVGALAGAGYFYGELNRANIELASARAQASIAKLADSVRERRLQQALEQKAAAEKALADAKRTGN